MSVFEMEKEKKFICSECGTQVKSEKELFVYFDSSNRAITKSTSDKGYYKECYKKKWGIKMNFEQTLKEVNDLIKHGQELIEKLKQEKEFNDLMKHGQELIEKLKQEKEPVKEADENDIGKLCEFWDGDNKGHAISTLERLQPGRFTYKATYGAGWEHCRRLTPAEVAKITGYKVEK